MEIYEFHSLSSESLSCESIFMAFTALLALKSSTALSKVLLTCLHISIRSWHASFKTSLAGSPAKFHTKTNKYSIDARLHWRSNSSEKQNNALRMSTEERKPKNCGRGLKAISMNNIPNANKLIVNWWLRTWMFTKHFKFEPNTKMLLHITHWYPEIIKADKWIK